MEFKDRLKSLRQQAGLTQGELGKKLGLSPSIVGMYEQGRRSPTYEGMEQIADIFNVDIDYLTGKETKSAYYSDPETQRIAEAIANKPGLKVLFSAAKDSSPESLTAAAAVLEALKKQEQGDD